MGKNSQILLKLAVGATILLGVLLILFANNESFQTIIFDDIENISKLSSSMIYSEIDTGLTQPIFVGQTMANDLFLKNWLAAESPTGANPEQSTFIQQYLTNYRRKYGYDSVFLVSAQSGVYYHQDGINKVISPQDPHDVWYYLFAKNDKLYDLDVDLDEANNNNLTVFVNCKILGDNGELAGVVGVGIQMSHLQELLRYYESEYHLRAFLMNEDGLLQVDSLEENIEKINFFDNPENAAFKDRICANKASMEIFWYPEGATDHCIITQYVDNLDWYVVVEKDTAAAHQQLTRQIHSDLLFVTLLIVVVLLMISYVISKYNRMLLKTASIDDVTNLPNVKMFQENYNRNLKRPACRQGVLFLFDIDHFKEINDRFGHLFGNTVLYRIGEITKEVVGSNGLAARWGGDEFIGTIYCSEKEADVLLHTLLKRICELQINELHEVSISLGATQISTEHSNLDVLFQEADTAMYRSKKCGRGRFSYFS